MHAWRESGTEKLDAGGLWLYEIENFSMDFRIEVFERNSQVRPITHYGGMLPRQHRSNHVPYKRLVHDLSWVELSRYV